MSSVKVRLQHSLKYHQILILTLSFYEKRFWLPACLCWHSINGSLIHFQGGCQALHKAPEYFVYIQMCWPWLKLNSSICRALRIMKKYREERHLVEQHINVTLPAYLMSLVYLIHLISCRKAGFISTSIMSCYMCAVVISQNGCASLLVLNIHMLCWWIISSGFTNSQRIY